MAKMERKSFDNPEETRSIDKGKIEVVKLGDVTAMRVRFEPGWKWSECVKPVVGSNPITTPMCRKAVKTTVNVSPTATSCRNGVRACRAIRKPNTP